MKLFNCSFFTLLLLALTYQKSDAQINPENFLDTLSTDQEIKFKPGNPINYNGMRQLDECNIKDGTDSYSWLSEDGLRIYFTQTNENMDDIVFANRDNISQEFSKATSLNLRHGEKSIFSSWLTKDELAIFYIERTNEPDNNYSLKYSLRENRNDPFTTSHTIKLIGDVGNFFAGPSFTHDLEQLFLYSSGFGKGKIIQLNKIGKDKYELQKTLPIPNTIEPKPGQLTMDGLRYYLTTESYTEKSQFCYFERSSVQDPFQNINEIEFPKIGDSAIVVYQPSITNNGKFMCFTKSSNQNWKGNDLFIIENNIQFNPKLESNITNLNNIFVPFEQEQIAFTEMDFLNTSKPPFTSSPKSITQNPKNNMDNAIILFPNPAKEKITFEINKRIQSVTDIMIYSSTGKLMDKIFLQANQKKIVIDLDKYPPGFYFYKTSNEFIESNTNKFIVN